jgi:hypothetical protein
MTKTSTTRNSESLACETIKAKDSPENRQDELFYHNLKPQLDKLIKNPTDETVEKILAYAKKK